METGEVRRPIPPSRVLVVSEQRERETQREREREYRMSSGCSVLTSVKTSLRQSSATVLLLQLRMQVLWSTGPLTEEMLPCGKTDKRTRGGNDKLLTHT